MKFIGWCIFIFYFMVSSTSDHWQVYFGMFVGLMLIAGGYYLGKR